MAQQTAIALDSKSYVPFGTRGDISTWVFDGDTDFGGGRSVLTESVRGPSKVGVYRVQWKLEIPLVADDDTACSCEGAELGNSIVKIEVTFPRNYSATMRADVRKRLASLVADNAFKASIDNKEPSW